MIKHVVSFMFAGNRNYVRGTDIYTAVIDLLGEDGLADIRFTYSAPIAVCRCNVHIDDDEANISAYKGSKVKGSVERSGARLFFAVEEIQESGEGCGRYAFDEDALVAGARYDDGSIEQTVVPQSSTPIELVVALTKALHNRLYPPETGKWIVTKLEFPRLIPLSSAVKIEIKHNFHMKLTKSEIIADGNRAGFVYFSLAAQ